MSIKRNIFAKIQIVKVLTSKMKDSFQLIEKNIEEQRKSVSFDMREFTLEFYVKKYLEDLDSDKNELYIPEYQREFIWDIKHQSRFIESLFLGLPVPFIFAAEIKKDGRLEIVDGSQRIRTVAAYLNDELKLESLKKLTRLNGTTFSMLSTSRQRLFKNTPMRLIVLSADATEEVRKEMFDRINTSSVPLLPMETRRGIYRGKFMDFITEMANKKVFKDVCPLNFYFQNRREEEELALRFFAFSDIYPNFSQVESKGVASFLDCYLEDKNKNFTQEEREQKERDFQSVIDFVSTALPGQGFAKKKSARGISKPYFEAISIGILLALRENPKITKKFPERLILDKNNPNDFYNMLLGRYQTHTAKKIKERIEYVKLSFQ